MPSLYHKKNNQQVLNNFMFKQWLEMALGNQYWYHITYAKNLSSIQANGLKRNAKPNWGHGGYDAHSRQGIFVTSPRLLGYWIERFENLAEHNSDDVFKDKLLPIILRFYLHDNKLKADDMANPEDRIYDAIRIPPERIEMWNGHEWTPNLSIYSLKAADFFQKMDGYVSFKERYPMPSSPL